MSSWSTAVTRFSVVFALLLCFDAVASAADEEYRCGPGNFHERSAGPGVTWTALASGTRLHTWDGILTCDGARVVIVSNLGFGSLRSHVRWTDGERGHEGTIPERLLVVLHPLQTSESIIVDVSEVVGRAFYSRDCEVFENLHLIESGSGTRRDAGVMDRERQTAQMHDDLVLIPWLVLSEGDVLSRGEMLWTRAGGRVEVEIAGSHGLVYHANDVIDREGRPTGRRRFSSDIYWTNEYEEDRVTRVIGEVWRSADREAVTRFVDAHDSWAGTARDPAVAEAERQAVEQLRRDDPVGFERWRARYVEERRRLLHWLRGGE
jgi:hypothetical protein